MLYTTQQLTGGPKYNHKVKIGNWQEDMEIEEIKHKDLDERQRGNLDMYFISMLFNLILKYII